MIYESDTTNPVYANIIAAELVWQQARLRVLLNLPMFIGGCLQIAANIAASFFPWEDPFEF